MATKLVTRVYAPEQSAARAPTSARGATLTVVVEQAAIDSEAVQVGGLDVLLDAQPNRVLVVPRTSVEDQAYVGEIGVGRFGQHLFGVRV